MLFFDLINAVLIDLLISKLDLTHLVVKIL